MRDMNVKRNRRSTCSNAPARAIRMRPTGSSPATSARCGGGRPAGCPNGRATWPIPTTLSRKRSFRHLRGFGQFEPRGVGALHAYLRQAVLNRIREELRRKARRPDGTGLTGARSRKPALAARAGDRQRGDRAVRDGARAAQARRAGDASSAASSWATRTRNWRGTREADA